jgi:hypothetical protein
MNLAKEMPSEKSRPIFSAVKTAELTELSEASLSVAKISVDSNTSDVEQPTTEML